MTVRDNARENYLYFRGKTKAIHHSFEAPAEVSGDRETRLNAFRKIRDEKKYFGNDFVKAPETK